MAVDDQLCQAKNFTAQVKGVTETGLLTLFSCERLDGFKVEIVIEMEVVQVLSMDQQVKHVVALPADLETNLDPVEGSGLEEFGRFERSEEITFLLRLRLPVVQRIEDKVLEQLLIRHTHLKI